jgi:hypothetical protein
VKGGALRVLDPATAGANWIMKGGASVGGGRGLEPGGRGGGGRWVGT